MSILVECCCDVCGVKGAEVTGSLPEGFVKLVLAAIQDDGKAAAIKSFYVCGACGKKDLTIHEKPLVDAVKESFDAVGRAKDACLAELTGAGT